MDLRGALAFVAGCLESLDRPWALVGALAVAARSEARATLDIDVAVAVDNLADSQWVTSKLREAGLTWQSDLGPAMTSFSVPEGPPAGLKLDVLFSLAGIENEVARDAESLEVLPGLELPVAALGDLIALKLLSAEEPEREHDLRDLRTLLVKVASDDIDRARSLIQLLEARDRVPKGRLGASLDRLVNASG